MKFLVIGCGSIGKRHIENIQKISKNILIEIFDEDESKLAGIEKGNVKIVDAKKIDSDSYDCVLICTPPITHIDLAIRALNANSNVFIEKPLSNNFEKIDDVIQLKNEKNLLVFVGYSFRFNKGLNWIKQIVDTNQYGKILHVSSYFGQYLPDWRPNQNFNESYTLKKEMGGGIILDSSHEIDYLTWIFGKPELIQSNYVGTNILPSTAEAICDVILQFSEDILATIHIDFVRRKYRRTLEILTENSIIEWSLKENSIKIFDTRTDSEEMISFDKSINEMYVEEMKHIINCITDHKNSEIVSLENGISTLKLSQQIIDCKK